MEMQTGLPPASPAGVRPREPYDPARHTLAEREAVKATEAGQPTSAVTVKRMRLRYRSEGLWAWSTTGPLARRPPKVGSTTRWSRRSRL
ncbi:hypothetical protein [Micromonospora peucetia]|uniref:hypothetical protein n=1 Tax=Micromonospora peucetia TaxID=47871 RepID=UPI00159F2CCA|nr:hypothetical protein [Micromonospora peucetia]